MRTLPHASILALFFALPLARAETEAPRALALDFTFPTAQVVNDVGRLRGIAVDPGGQAVALLSQRAELIIVSLAGELLDRHPLPMRATLTGLTWPSANEVLLTSRSGRLFHYELHTRVLTRAGAFRHRRDIEALAYSASDDITYAISNRGAAKLLRMSPSGRTSVHRLWPWFRGYRFTGLAAIGDSLFATARRTGRGRGPRSLVVELSDDGLLRALWQIDGSPTGLAVLGVSRDGPTLLTANADVDSTVQLYEPPTPAGEPDATPLSFLGEFSLGEELAAQPSGVSYSALDNRLYYVTDFGRVASSALDGSEAMLEFEVPGTLQGTFESVSVDAGGDIRLVASDASTTTRELRFDEAGNPLGEGLLALRADGNDDDVVEAFAIDDGTQQRWWVNHLADERKTLYTDGPGNQVTATDLSDELTGLAITGMEVSGDTAILVSDQRLVSGRLVAGVAVAIDLRDGEEIDRYSIAVPGADGVLRGVVSPSGVAFNADSGVLYITSDTDDGTVYAFELGDDD